MRDPLKLFQFSHLVPITARSSCHLHPHHLPHSKTSIQAVPSVFYSVNEAAELTVAFIFVLCIIVAMHRLNLIKLL